MNGVQEKEQNQIRQFAEQAVGALSSAAKWATSSHRHPSTLLLQRLFATVVEGLHCLVALDLGYSTELKSLLAEEVDATLQASDSAWNEVNIPGPGPQCYFGLLFFLFFKGVLRVCRHKSRGFEHLIL